MPLSRRHAFACAACLALAPRSSPRAAGPGAPTNLDASGALRRLMAGNARFVADQPHPAAPQAERRRALAQGQAPFAAVLGCSDSRTAPEILFAAGLGELFTVRVAGNGLATTELGTLEYATGALGVPLIMVLGHEGCGAVAAAVQVAEQGVMLPFALMSLVDAILPAVAEAKRGNPNDLLDAAVRVHARRTARALRQASAGIAARVADGRLRVVAAHYDLREGAVSLLDD
jgi:carbonic anhydrase